MAIIMVLVRSRGKKLFVTTVSRLTTSGLNRSLVVDEAFLVSSRVHRVLTHREFRWIPRLLNCIFLRSLLWVVEPCLHVEAVCHDKLNSLSLERHAKVNPSLYRRNLSETHSPGLV